MVYALLKIALIFSMAMPVLSIVLVPDLSYAQSRSSKVGKRKKRKRRDRGQDAVVIVDGSAVYQAQNFDAPVMEYLDRGSKVKISKKVYPGIGGLGTFYKIRLRKGVYGYITDVDIEISGKSGIENTRNQLNNNNEISDDPLKIRDDLEKPDPVTVFGKTMYLTRFFGLEFSSVDYTEKIAGSAQSSTESMFGIRLSGPGKQMGGLPIDYGLKFLTSAPSFYDKFFASSSGFLIMSHAYAMFPFLVDKPTQVLYYQFGPTLKYSAFDVKTGTGSALAGLNVDSQEIVLGAGLGLGYAIRFGKKWSLRLDAVYQYENEGYMDLSAAVQMQY